MRRALLLLALCASCSLRAPRNTAAAPCSSSSQCGRTDVCFLGECRGPASHLSIVRVEVRPPSDSPLGILQLGSIDALLRPTASAELVTQAGKPVGVEAAS